MKNKRRNHSAQFKAKVAIAVRVNLQTALKNYTCLHLGDKSFNLC